jgi:hypothetical protein
MQRKHHMWLMIVNGLLFFVNGLFIVSGSMPDVNLVAALISLFGFTCAYCNWLKHEDE